MQDGGCFVKCRKIVDQIGQQILSVNNVDPNDPIGDPRDTEFKNERFDRSGNFTSENY
jgi:hypothetical protein